MNDQYADFVRTHSQAKSNNQREVLAQLACRCNEEHQCYPSVQTVADDSGISKRTTQTILQTLVVLGELHVEPGAGFKSKRNPTSRYTVLLPDDVSDTPETGMGAEIAPGAEIAHKGTSHTYSRESRESIGENRCINVLEEGLEPIEEPKSGKTENATVETVSTSGAIQRRHRYSPQVHEISKAFAEALIANGKKEAWSLFNCEDEDWLYSVDKLTRITGRDTGCDPANTAWWIEALTWFAENDVIVDSKIIVRGRNVGGQLVRGQLVGGKIVGRETVGGKTLKINQPNYVERSWESLCSHLPAELWDRRDEAKIIPRPAPEKMATAECRICGTDFEYRAFRGEIDECPDCQGKISGLYQGHKVRDQKREPAKLHVVQDLLSQESIKERLERLTAEKREARSA
jgi:hypothetical protein